MYVDEPPKDGNIPDFNISKIDICPFRAYQRSFRLFQSDFSTDIHQRSRLLCFTQNDHTGQTGFKICSFLKWAHKSIPRLKVETFTSIKVAEAAKLMENTQRDILIAFPNEYLDFCTQIGIDINDVIAEATQNGISHKSILDLSEDIVLV